MSVPPCAFSLQCVENNSEFYMSTYTLRTALEVCVVSAVVLMLLVFKQPVVTLALMFLCRASFGAFSVHFNTHDNSADSFRNWVG